MVKLLDGALVHMSACGRHIIVLMFVLAVPIALCFSPPGLRRFLLRGELGGEHRVCVRERDAVPAV